MSRLRVCHKQVLFLTEVDNLAYSLGLPEAWKARVEEAAREELAPEEESAIARTKAVHMVVVTVTLISGVAIATTGNPAGFMLPFAGFLLGGIIDVCLSGKPPKDMAKDVAKVFVSVFIGFSFFWQVTGLAGAKEG